jgi:DNA anti-recombination protein RmuC
MDIGGTAKKIQKATKIAEESYKKMQAMTERMKDLQKDMETTSRQVDEMEYELAQQRALLEAVATEQGLDPESVLADADLPEPPQREDQNAEKDEQATTQKATSRPSADDSDETTGE